MRKEYQACVPGAAGLIVSLCFRASVPQPDVGAHVMGGGLAPARKSLQLDAALEIGDRSVAVPERTGPMQMVHSSAVVRRPRVGLPGDHCIELVERLARQRSLADNSGQPAASRNFVNVGTRQLNPRLDVAGYLFQESSEEPDGPVVPTVGRTPSAIERF